MSCEMPDGSADRFVTYLRPPSAGQAMLAEPIGSQIGAVGEECLGLAAAIRCAADHVDLERHDATTLANIATIKRLAPRLERLLPRALAGRG